MKFMDVTKEKGGRGAHPSLVVWQGPRTEFPRELKILAVHQPKLLKESLSFAEVCQKSTSELSRPL